jgi:EAL domain-containing protein (putative c-di-GMP-specific phosphodiesterase class I)
MHIDEENLEIVKAIVSLAGNLKLDLIAEGLEKTDQLVRLRELNCAYGQGFLLSRPMDAAAVEVWLQKKLPDAAS